MPVGQWNHLAATFDGSFLSLYINGELRASSAATLGAPNTVPLLIGGCWLAVELLAAPKPTDPPKEPPSDSVAEREYEETLNKARAVLRAVQLARPQGS